jgi:hypothetical protein
MAHPESEGIADVAVVRVEQLYPLPAEHIRAALERYPNATDVVWVQEKPSATPALGRARLPARARYVGLHAGRRHRALVVVSVRGPLSAGERGSTREPPRPCLQPGGSVAAGRPAGDGRGRLDAIAPPARAEPALPPPSMTQAGPPHEIVARWPLGTPRPVDLMPT